MKENEVIIVNGIPDAVYNAIIDRAIKYALLSIPFTYNRMNITNLMQKIHNIAKGKTAELLFRLFCYKNNIEADFEKCTTPFYQPDKKDFILNGFTWDIKNNFIYHQEDVLPSNISYTHLPALIPDKDEKDQWSKRNEIDAHTKGVMYLFTFLKNRDTYEKNENFIKIQLTSGQEKLILKLYEKFKDIKTLHKEPYPEEVFWNEMKFGKDQYTISHRPYLIITGYAGTEQWPLFKSSGEGIKKYCNGLLITKINNRFTEVFQLSAFSSLFPQLSSHINYGEMRKIIFS